MGWTIVVFVVLLSSLHAFLLVTRAGRRSLAALGYASLVLAALALVCAAAAWRGAEADRAGQFEARSARDRDFVVLIHTIDAARDMACKTETPRSTDEALLAAYTRMRTTCAYYAMVWVEAARSSDLPGVLAAAEKPWPSTGSPRQQLWHYGPLEAETARIEAELRRPTASATGLDTLLAAALPLVLASLLAVLLSSVTVALRRPRRSSITW